MFSLGFGFNGRNHTIRAEFEQGTDDGFDCVVADFFPAAQPRKRFDLCGLEAAHL